MQYTKITALGIIVVLMTAQCASDGKNGKNDTPKEDISHLTSMEFTRQMSAGWNLGNTLDSHWNKAAPWTTVTPANIEQIWGNPITTRAMINKVKAEGFNVVRIPVTWYLFTGPAPDYTINTAWMNRVQEVVDYVINNDMFCILNTHHEDYEGGGWLRLCDGSNALNIQETQEINNRFKKIWEQIAGRFKDYDEYLIFEGLNEPRGNGNANSELWAAQYDVLNSLLKSFIDTVRASGGGNSNRHLMVTPYFAQIDLHGGGNKADLFMDTAAKKLKVTDPKNRLIVSLHYYEPYYFAGAASSDSNSLNAYDPNHSHISWNNSRVIDTIKQFTNNGIPVIMGETGALDKNNEAERVKWSRDYVAKVRALGVPVVIWDDGGSFQLFDRKNLKWKFPALTRAFVNAAQAP